MFELKHGDCLDVLRTMADNSIDAVVTDPPYGLSFMGKRWDYDVPDEAVWRECLRVLKPGGHLLAFAGTRTQHRMAVRIEDAGFEIRDMIAWVYGSGFPKSLDVSKAIDKAAGAVREVVNTIKKTPSASSSCNEGWVRPWAEGKTTMDITAPATSAAKKWAGWGTALKPALEPITVARKPIVGTVANNVITWGTGGINVDGCRVDSGGTHGSALRAGQGAGYDAHNQPGRKYGNGLGGIVSPPNPAGRFPANFIHDGSEEAVLGMAESSRYFYCAKASKRDRDEGCEGMESRKAGAMSGVETRDGKPTNHPMRTNHHPTVKPTDLMRYLCRLVTPPNGTVLDPFMGSGSTGKAAILEGFRFIGIEREAEYLEIARARIDHVTKEPNLWQS